MLDRPEEPGLSTDRPRSAPRFSRDEETLPPGRRGSIVQLGAEEEKPTPRAAASDPQLRGIQEMLERGERLEAHKEMSRLYWKHPELVPELRGFIDDNAKLIYFSSQPHYMEPYVVEPGDLLSKIGRKYSVSWEYLAKLNQTDPKKIRAGQRLKVIKGPFAALIDLSDFELTVHCHGYYVKRYPIGIGKSNSTPTGKFTVKAKQPNPTYWGPNGNVIEADDPSNPLGERWIDLGDSYGIHGTIDPSSIGKAESKGCIRLKNPDVEEVYDLLIEGSEVIIRQ
jgi:LysM repeat protein